MKGHFSIPEGLNRYELTFRTALALILSIVSVRTLAQTDEIQVYDASIAAPGIFNLTWHNNYTPSGQRAADHPGGVVPDRALNGVTEWAYGVAPWFETGLYLPLYTVAADGSILWDGFKIRQLFVSPNAAQRSFFYGINFEFSYNRPQWDAHRYTSEIRPIIGWHLGPVDLIFNPILDNAYKGLRQLTFAPASRLAWNFSPRFSLAAEEYDEFGPVRQFYAHGQQSHQLFSVFDYTGAPLNIEVGVGFGLTDATDHRVLKLILSRDLNGPG